MLTDQLSGGDKAGIKTVTMQVWRWHGFGISKGNGVHRLVRVSPFNAQGKTNDFIFRFSLYHWWTIPSTLKSIWRTWAGTLSGRDRAGGQNVNKNRNRCALHYKYIRSDGEEKKLLLKIPKAALSLVTVKMPCGFCVRNGMNWNWKTRRAAQQRWSRKKK